MAKRPFSMDYPQYDTSQGFGTPREWRAAFRAAMGLDEARTRVGSLSPEVILGLAIPFTATMLKSAYRKAAMASHPDRFPGDPTAEERFKRVHAAYVVLQARMEGQRA
jgi:hypothetical protein